MSKKIKSARCPVAKKTADQIIYMKEIGHRSNYEIANKLGLAWSTVEKVKAVGKPVPNR